MDIRRDDRPEDRFHEEIQDEHHHYRGDDQKRQTVSDLSAVVTGVLLGLNLPPSLPVYMAAIGCFAAIVVVKQFFGGIGQNFANPAITARIVLMLSFGKFMTSWSAPICGSFSGRSTRISIWFCILFCS